MSMLGRRRCDGTRGRYNVVDRLTLNRSGNEPESRAVGEVLIVKVRSAYRGCLEGEVPIRDCY